MIKYNLTCKDCSKLFDSWFASSKEFEKLKKLNYLNCPSCNSLNIDKSLMSPSVLTTKKQKNTLDDQKHKKEVRKKIKNIRNLLRIILIMLVKTLHMRQDLFTMAIKRKKMVFMEMLLKGKLKNLKRRE